VTIASTSLAFTLTGTGTFAGTPPTTLTATALPGSNNTQWAITLSGQAPGVLASIANGTYSITVNPTFILSVADGISTLASGRTDSFFRLFGDINGDGNVTNGDLNAFRQAFTPLGGTYNPAFDYNGDQGISNTDLNQMRKDFLLNFFP
jgi:hypothetical protein